MSNAKYPVSLQLDQESQDLCQSLRRELQLSHRDIYLAGLYALAHKVKNDKADG